MLASPKAGPELLLDTPPQIGRAQKVIGRGLGDSADRVDLATPLDRAFVSG